VIGIGIGRASFLLGGRRAISTAALPAHRSADSTRTLAASDSPQQTIDPTTSRYLGQAAALLIALPAEANVGRPDRPFIK
jgi:hypothetical protein